MNIKRYNTFLNEQSAEYDFGFSSVIESKNVDYHNFPVEGEQYIDSGDLIIDWEMDFDNRKNGINSMAPIIKHIKASYTLVTPTEGKDKEEENSFEANKDSDWDIVCEFKSDYQFGYSIMPESVTVDYKDQKILVQF